MKRIITKTEQKLIQDMLNKRCTRQQIADKLNVSRNTLMRIIKENSFDLSNHKKPSGREIKLSEQQINNLKDMLNNNYLYKDIARKMGVNRNMISLLIEKYDIDIPHKSLKRVNSDYLIQFIKEITKEKISIRQIAKISNSDSSTIKKIIENHNINFDCSSRNYDFSDDKKIFYINRYIELCDKYICSDSNYTKNELQYVRKNIDKKPVYKIAKAINKTEDSLAYVINKMDLNKILTFDNIFELPYKEEFEKDLCNPSLGDTTVARKYGISYTSINVWRKKKYKNFKTRVNIWLNKSSAEIKFENILNDLDIVYEYQKNIDIYKVDFYLGQKLIVEIQGDYWHTLDKVIKSDEDKKNFLENKNYTILYVWEHELLNNEKVKEKVILYYKKAMQSFLN